MRDEDVAAGKDRGNYPDSAFIPASYIKVNPNLYGACFCGAVELKAEGGPVLMDYRRRKSYSHNSLL